MAPDETLDGLLAALQAQAARSERVIAGHDLDEAGQPGERWDGAPPATLERVLFHLSRSTPATWATWTSSASWPAAPTGE